MQKHGNIENFANHRKRGTPVILSWTVSNDSYDYIDAVGPVRAGTQTGTPGATTIYTLYSSNQYGRATKSVTVNVQ